MKTKTHQLAIKAVSLFLFTGAAAAQSDDKLVYQDSTNRLTLSLRFGLNVSASFKGIGNSLNQALSLSRKTPNGDPYNYDNGYVLTDISGDAGGQSWYWGYDNASQVNSTASTITFNRATALLNAGSDASDGDSAATPGFELDYNRQLGVKESWHNLRFGLDSAISFDPISINNNDTVSAEVSDQTDMYSYTPLTMPPTAPYEGSFQGPGFVINVPPGSSTATYPVLSQDSFDASLFGLHLGPYVEMPFGKKEEFTLSLAGGLALGLLDANESWTQTLAIPANGTLIANGNGNSLDVLWGWYAGANADYQFNEHWGVAGGVQFQDLGTYNHNFDGRQVSLDLSRSILILVGVSYNF
jgi:hypothetical protein